MAPKSFRARRLGIALRNHRESAGLTLEQAADEISSTRSTLSRYENAQTMASPATVRALLTLYKVNGAEVTELVQLAKEARRPGWWVSYSYILDKRTIDFIAVEAEATAISNFEPSGNRPAGLFEEWAASADRRCFSACLAWAAASCSSRLRSRQALHGRSVTFFRRPSRYLSSRSSNSPNFSGCPQEAITSS